VKLCPVCSTEYPDDVRFCPNDGQTLRASSAGQDLLGQVIADRYHVLKKLGEGGMGQVYLAEHVKMGRKGAIKVMTPAMVHDPDAVARFNREAANASRISHPNVCAIYDFGETPEGLIYLAMEFIEGEPLTNLLEHGTALPVERAVRIFVQVADALQAAHDLGIVHRDLKPDNIMLSRARDGSDVVKVVDFGIAKAVGGDDTQRVTKTGLVVGTPEFMSPEQLSGDKLDGRSDIYSLALVLFKMLTGTLPFQATTVQETMIKRLTDEPVRLAEARPDLPFPAGLQEALDAGLARTPADRYQSVTRFAADVMKVVGSPRASALLAVPSTRSDADPQTELLKIPVPFLPVAVPPAPSASARRRGLVPILAGALVLVAGASAAVRLLGGGGRPGVDTSPDTARPATVTAPGHDTARTPVAPALKRSRPGRRATGAGPARPAQFDPATASRVLDSLIDRPPAIVIDSALIVFNAPRVPVKERAFAACLLARAYRDTRDSARALEWAQRGLALDAGLQSCQDVVQNPGGP
jgi:eukaryotic-like serine/threonine-protein kinase